MIKMSPMSGTKRPLSSVNSTVQLSPGNSSPDEQQKISPAKRACRLSPSKAVVKPKFVSELRIAVVCSSNQNRSMEAHNLLKKRGYNVESYGTGSCVKLPGPTIDKPNVYDFSVTYDEQRQDLKRKDVAFYTQNGLLNMLDRNRRIKAHPEKFQECKEEFDIVVTCQERVFDQVIEYFTNNGNMTGNMAHVINVEIKDNHEDATLGAFVIHDLIREICGASDPEAELEDIIEKMEAKKNQKFLYSPSFY